MSTGLGQAAQPETKAPAEPLTTVASGCLDEIRTCHSLMDAITMSVFGRSPREGPEAAGLESMEGVIGEVRAQASQLRVRLDEFVTTLAG